MYELQKGNLSSIAIPGWFGSVNQRPYLGTPFGTIYPRLIFWYGRSLGCLSENCSSICDKVDTLVEFQIVSPFRVRFRSYPTTCVWLKARYSSSFSQSSFWEDIMKECWWKFLFPVGSYHAWRPLHVWSRTLFKRSKLSQEVALPKESKQRSTVPWLKNLGSQVIGKLDNTGAVEQAIKQLSFIK
jgi:hypothetical protein